MYVFNGKLKLTFPHVVELSLWYIFPSWLILDDLDFTPHDSLQMGFLMIQNFKNKMQIYDVFFGYVYPHILLEIIVMLLLQS